jgi:magnesium transporter
MRNLISQPAIRGALKAGDAGKITQLITQAHSANAVDVAELLNRAPSALAADVLQRLGEPRATQILDEPQLARSPALLSALPAAHAARLLDQMAADRAVAAIREMRTSVRNELLGLVTPATRSTLDALLPYPEGCAARIMTTEFFAVPADWNVQQTLAYLREVEHTRETVYAVFVLDPASLRLVCAVPLRALIVADPKTAVLAAAPNRELIYVAPDTPLDETVRIVSRYNLLAVPVVDTDGRILGIVTVDDAIDTLVAQQDAQIQRVGGVQPLEEPYMQAGFWTMIRKRAGWLCALFLAEMLTASAMQHFEDQLQRAVVLALFIPLIMSSGGNSGSQATSVVIRALALGEVQLGEWWRVLLRELPSGLVLGAILGVIGALRVSLWQGIGVFDYGEHWLLIAMTIAAALIGIVTFGSVVGSLLPFAVRKLGFDPATASAPFVATFVDVTGIVIYFSVAMLILHGTLL